MSEDPAAKIRRALGSILMCWEDSLEPVRRSAGSHVKTSREPPLPISAHILDVRAQTRARMAGACHMVIQERDLHTEHLSALNVIAMADLLDRHADWLATCRCPEVVAAELEKSARDLRAITTPYRKDWQSLGTCPLTVEVVVEVEGKDVLEVQGCTGTIRAYGGDTDPYCDGCGVQAVTTWWEQRMFTDPELRRLLTAAELVTFIHAQFGRPVTQVAIRQWIRRGIITKADTNDKGQTLYDKGAVAYALQRRKVVA